MCLCVLELVCVCDLCWSLFKCVHGVCVYVLCVHVCVCVLCCVCCVVCVCMCAVLCVYVCIVCVLCCVCIFVCVYVTARLLTVDPFVNRSTGL